MPRIRKYSAPIKAAVIDAFIEQGSSSFTSLARRFTTPAPGQTIGKAVYEEFRRLGESGTMLTEQTGRAGRGESPVSFDFSGLGRFSDPGTLADVVNCYLLANDVLRSARRALRSALRAYFGLPFRCDDATLLQACRGIPVSVLYAFLGDFRDSLVRRGGLKVKTVDNHATAIRRATRYALERDAVPMLFPPQRPDDAWSAAVDEAYPLAGCGQTTPAVRKLRSGMLALRAAHQQYAPEHAGSPDQVTAESIKTCLSELREAGAKGQAEAISDLRQLLRRNEFGGASPVTAHLARALDAAQRPAAKSVYLQSPSGARVSRRWSDLTPLLAEHGFPNDWAELFNWYYEYSTLPWRTVQSRSDVFPPRLARRHLGERTMTGRAGAVRAYLGIALRDIGVRPGDLHPCDVFGRLFKPITDTLLARWAEKAADPDDCVSHESSMGAHHFVVGGGLIALALYERLRHARGRAVRVRETAGNRERLDIIAEEAVEKDPRERELFDAYRYSVILSKNLERDRKAASTGHGANTVEDILVLARQTPHQQFVEAQKFLLQEISDRRSAGEASTREYHELVHAAMLHGLLLSTGCRISEAAHVRYDIQYRRIAGAPREIKLRVVDRKNEKAHIVVLRDAFVPGWLEEEFLTRTRRFFMRDQHVIRRAIDAIVDHPWVFVMSETGKPYGCPEEKPNGTERDEMSLKERVRTLALTWKRWMTFAFKHLRYLVPRGRMQFTPHVLRNVLGFGIFQRDGSLACANFLGDSEASVIGHYGDVDGRFYDSSGLEPLAPSAARRTTRPGVEAGPAQPGKILEGLFAAVEAQEITLQQYQRLKARLTGDRPAA